MNYASVLMLLCMFVACKCETTQKTATDNAYKQFVSKTELAHRSAEFRTQESTESKEPDEIAVLFIGNSHSAPIPELLTTIFKRQKPETKTWIRKASGSGFLVDHLRSRATTDLIRSRKWDYVVLQAQKYSTTGKYTYPTDAAIKLSNIAKESGAKILMYPEWSRKSFPDEYQRIRSIHDSIAEKTGATVAPIGECWKMAISDFGITNLYARDGNHATGNGSYLNACVFYSVITNESSEAPAGNAKRPPGVKRKLERIAWKVVKETFIEANE